MRSIVSSMSCIMAAFFICAAFLHTPAYALTDEQETKYRTSIQEFADSLTAQQKVMQDTGWSEVELEHYLSDAAWMVYLGKAYANMRVLTGPEFNDTIAQTNNDLTQLVALGFLPFWPANPLNEWAPMQVLKPGSEFSAGDLCFALCPMDYATTLHIGKTQVSFDMFIFGPEESLGSFGEIVQVGSNKKWSNPPRGAMCGHSFNILSDMEYAELLKKS
jgi:hypothetical protein